MTNRLQDLLNLGDEAWSRDVSIHMSGRYVHLQSLTDVKDRHSEFDVPEMARTLCHALLAGRTPVSAVDGAQLGVVQPFLARSLPLLVHRLRVLDVADAHVLDLLRREEAELDLLHRLQWC